MKKYNMKRNFKQNLSATAYPADECIFLYY